MVLMDQERMCEKQRVLEKVFTLQMKRGGCPVCGCTEIIPKLRFDYQNLVWAVELICVGCKRILTTPDGQLKAFPTSVGLKAS